MFVLENQLLKIAVNPIGAELDSVFHKDFGLEYMWSGDSDFWGKKSPVLFPIVGSLKENTYFFEGQEYQLSRHGFARERVFILEKQDDISLLFTLQHDSETLKKYPFKFLFQIKYTLVENKLSVTYIVENQSLTTMPFSVGAHPAFKIPLVDDTTYEDYFLEINKKETFGRYPLSIDGLIESKPNIFFENDSKIPLKKELFYADAVVLKDMESTKMSIKSDKTSHGLTMDFEGFPYFGIWAAKDAPFVCLEPWCGIADTILTTQNIVEKEGINILEVGGVFERTWSIEMF
jgi:galactose mutarotase-like enzyme